MIQKKICSVKIIYKKKHQVNSLNLIERVYKEINILDITCDIQLMDEACI